MKRFRVNVAVIALIIGISVSAFTTRESANALSLNHGFWYLYDQGDPEEPSSYWQIPYAHSNEVAEAACPVDVFVCLGRFEAGAFGEPIGEPKSILLGQFTP